jgi:hypothetical protein
MMEFISGHEGITPNNAPRAGAALRLLHEQRNYPHPCVTGLSWLLDLANRNLSLANISLVLPPRLNAEFPIDALIHSEPVQLIEREDGSIVFIDFEGIGMGSRYQDLGHVYYCAHKDDQPDIFNSFLEGYLTQPYFIEKDRIILLAGLISLAYAGFGLAFVGRAEFDHRISLGLRMFGYTGK